MVRRCAGSSQRRLSVAAEPLGSSGARGRRRSTVTQPPPMELLDTGSITQNLYRRSSAVDLNRRTSVASNGSTSTSSRQRSSDLEITDKDMERLLILYNSKKIELNSNSNREDDLKSNSSNSKGADTFTWVIFLVLGILAIFAYIICR
ncbi:hypothetical protein ACHWQZ_G011120 [Mnemiopsis leidyi]